MKVINIFAGVVISMLACVASAENNKNIVNAYKIKIELLKNEQVEKIKDKNINFNEISFAMCSSFMQGFISSKVKNKNEVALLQQSTDMLSVAYCQDLDSPSDMMNAFADMVNSERSRSVEEISNNPPIIHISVGAIGKYLNKP